MYAGLYDLKSKKKWAVQTEVVEDKAAQNFRDLARKQGKRTRQKHQGNFVYAMSVGLVLVLVIMGVCHAEQFLIRSERPRTSWKKWQEQLTR